VFASGVLSASSVSYSDDRSSIYSIPCSDSDADDGSDDGSDDEWEDLGSDDDSIPDLVEPNDYASVITWYQALPAITTRCKQLLSEVLRRKIAVYQDTEAGLNIGGDEWRVQHGMAATIRAQHMQIMRALLADLVDGN
jgi:hypothetical protein